jgi:transitional endoplasmic reticulum ATPase
MESAKLHDQAAAEPTGDKVGEVYFEHSSAKRVNTDALVTKTLKEEYPNLTIATAEAYYCNLLGYASAGHATFELIEDPNSKFPSTLRWERYVAPARRLDGGPGAIVDVPLFAKYLYKWRNEEFIFYIIDGRDGTTPYPQPKHYLLHPQREHSLMLMREVGRWGNELHEEIWVYDSGYWQKSRELFESIRNASWDNVILDEDMKKSIIEDHLGFFKARDTYAHLKVPWKRGIIYHGPPGNGKTISIKATMHQLYELDPYVPTLYVRSLMSVRRYTSWHIGCSLTPGLF